MKKFLSVLLSICLIFGIYSPVHAVSGPASSFEQGPVSDTGAWSKIKGCKYQVKVGKKTKTIKKPSYSTGSKARVRAVKIDEGIMYYSPWTGSK